MDPNEALKHCREAAATIIEETEDVHEGLRGFNYEAAEDLAEAFQALDEWLTKGGFLPAPWRSTATRFPRPVRGVRR